MRRGIAFLYPCAVVVAVVVSAAVVLAAPMYKVELVQVVHRHGARSPLVDDNHTLICGTEFPCGFLNYEGQAMLVNLGEYLRHRYTEDRSVVSTPYFPYSWYNLSISYTRSTDVLRTLQSANGLLRGLFPNNSDFFPAIHTVGSEGDVLLHSSMVPMIRARFNYAKQERRAACDQVLDRLMSFDQLQAVAAEVHSQGFCANYTLRSRCAERLCDIGRAYESTGRLGSLPLLNRHLEDVCAVTAMSSHFCFAYNASNPVHQKQGAPFYHLAKLLVSNMLAHQQRETAPPYKLYEYSAHDTTISPLAVSFGESSMEAMLPPFGTAFIMELLSLTDAPAASSRFYVRLLRGHSGAKPESNFTFALSHFDMRCRDATGNTYIATDNICPFTDFERFIDSTAPTSPMGTCYLDPGLLLRMDCPIDTSGDNRSLSEDCLFYRKHCSNYSCGTGYYLDAIDYNCHRIPANNSTTVSSPMSSGGIAALSIVLFIIGGVASIGGMEVWKRYKKFKGQQSEVLIV
ncbi:membrane-bound acid phosphatase precursor [Leishmania major strain Friedlin]|uniref:Membrane-bound acid phosphatase n=1 Tax=Leishmania major TaxID=5664 RepID=Q4Q1G4_LEIMA|nr:membrane-bound acid phosphatase precursor [Leishmania major strain Friedlin]CAG9583789.1 membrane-bound_acid_phosphatase_precursor [Leishmania major strain Friedlin]CAJ09215.1 membrane-bound acid phosphatase precursor [Leishmania major strain Friedlin]|eukprot:XP_001686834.1 membrane-bound acid phosphatase precursor [Leishmania major strain Friedlin]